MLGIIILILKFFIFSSEPFNTPGRINKLLFSRKKRMALRTNFNTDIFFGGSHFNGVAACALNDRVCICWMDVGFHFNFNPLSVYDA